MTTRARSILFIVLVVLFLLVAPSAVFYSQGYRFDFETKKIVQTGAFYFKVSPRGAEIYFTPLDSKHLTERNGKLKQKTSILTGSVLVENLLPKTYQIEIKKDGYHSWQKKLEIKEKQVTEIKNVVLIPEKPNFMVLAKNKEEINEILSKINIPETETEIEIPKTISDIALLYQVVGGNVIWLDKENYLYQSELGGVFTKETIAQNIKNFKISPDAKKTVYFNNYEIWILFLEDKYDQPKKKSGDQLFLTRFSEKIGDVFWLTNHYLMFNTGNKIKIAEIDDRNKINIVDLVEFKKPEIFWNHADKKLYVLSNGNLYSSDSLLP